MDWLIRTLENLLLPLRLYFGHKCRYDENRVVVKIWPNRLVKGPIHRAEYEALVFVKSHTNLPAPRVYRTYNRRDGLYVEREFIEGTPLDAVWNRLAQDERRQYVSQIWAQLEELRQHTPPASLGQIAVASVSGGPVTDGALAAGLVGPYRSLKKFEEGLRRNPNKLAFPSGWDTSDELRRIVLSNGDISPRNALVTKVGQVVLIDWEFGGFWPAYWERVKWHFADFPPGELRGWVEMMDEVSGMSSAAQ